MRSRFRENLASRPNEYFVQEDPTEDEIEKYARFIGLDPERDFELMWIAREGIKTPLPPSWKPTTNKEGVLVYLNPQSGELRLNHPLDDYYKRKVRIYQGLECISVVENVKRKTPKRIYDSNVNLHVEPLFSGEKSSIKYGEDIDIKTVNDLQTTPYDQFREKSNMKSEEESGRPDGRGLKLRKKLYRKKIDREKKSLMREISHLESKKDEALRVYHETLSKIDDIQSRMSLEKVQYQKKLVNIQMSITSKLREKESLWREIEQIREESLRVKQELRKKIKINQKNILLNQSLKISHLILRQNLFKVKKEKDDQELTLLRKIEEIGRENDQLKTDLATERNRNSKLVGQLETEERRRSDQVRSLTETNAAMSDINTQYACKLKKLVTHIEKEKIRSSQYEQLSKTQQFKLSELKNQINTLTEEKKMTFSTNIDLNSGIEKITRQLESMREEKLQDTKKIEVLKKKIRNLSSERKGKILEKSNLEKQLLEERTQSQSTIQSLSETIHEINQEKKHKYGQINDLDRRIHSICDLQTTFEKRNHEVEEMNDILREQNLRLKEELQEVRESWEEELEKVESYEILNRELRRQIVEFEIRGIQEYSNGLQEEKKKNDVILDDFDGTIIRRDEPEDREDSSNLENGFMEEFTVVEVSVSKSSENEDQDQEEVDDDDDDDDDDEEEEEEGSNNNDQLEKIESCGEPEVVAVVEEKKKPTVKEKYVHEYYLNGEKFVENEDFLVEF